MNFNYLKTIEFFYSLGYVTFTSIIITLILTGVVKFILMKTKVITLNTNSIKKDILLSRVGRYIALITYTSIYIIDILFIKKIELVFNMELISSLLSGSTLTLCISKGIYTGIRQMEKKNTIYEKLEVAEVTINKLQGEIKELNIETNNNEEKNNVLILGNK